MFEAESGALAGQPDKTTVAKGGLMAGNRKGQGGVKQLFYVYFPKGDRLVMFCPTIDDAGMSRISDLTMHFAGVRGIHRVETAFIVSCTKPDPPRELEIGTDPGPDDFTRFDLKLHQVKEL